MKESLFMKIMVMIIVAVFFAYIAGSIIPELASPAAIIVVGAFILDEVGNINLSVTKNKDKYAKTDETEEKKKTLVLNFAVKSGVIIV